MAMVGGDGADSYLRNSNLQAQVFKLLLSPAITRAIQENFGVFRDTKVIRIADIGCSSGPNCINAVDLVMDEILKRLGQAGESDVVDRGFEVFFSDLPSNDFNTLVKLLAVSHEQGKPYFYGALPGSFFKQLFPKCSVHFGMSNYALHWLSKIPPVENPGRVFVDDLSSPETIAAFSQQAHEDLCLFLKHRGEEIVPGGILSFCIVAPSKGIHKEASWPQAFQSAWEYLVAEGFISQECMDSFTVGLYLRTADEVEKAIQETKCFEVIHLEYTSLKIVELGKVAKGWKAVSGRIVGEHLKGDENLIELLYTKMEDIVASFPSDYSNSLVVTLRRA